MMQSSFDFHPNVVLRTPVFPFTQQIDKNAISAYLENSEFTEALYVASPSLHQQGKKWRQGQTKNEKETQKLTLAIAKYLNRSRSRCTPFGLFASSSVVAWGGADQVCLGKKVRHTRLTMSFLRELAQQLSRHELIYPYLSYYPNSSIYSLGDELRYVEYSSDQGKRTYQISSVAGSEDISHLLAICEPGLPYRDIVAHLSSRNIRMSDAELFINELIQAQVLVSELEPTVAGTDLLPLVIAVLGRVEQEQPDQQRQALIAHLRTVEEQLRILTGASDEYVDGYQRIINQVKPLNIAHNLSELFQVNLFREANQGKVDQRWQEKIRRAMEVFTGLAQPTESQPLNLFKQQFYERYEDTEMPLLSVLDTETGIGYGSSSGPTNSSLIEGLPSSSYGQQQEASQTGIAKQWLLQKIAHSEQHNHELISISKRDLKFLPSSEYRMPPSTSVIFRIIDNENIYLEGVSGTSATNLLGRFANDDENIRKLTQEIADTEQANNPVVIFAEIAHLPGQRVGNILRRPSLRRYEIPYLAQSMLPRNQQVRLQDLCISVRNGRIVLRSPQLDKEIIPRLSSAHNYKHQALPVYQFLCDLQSQGLDQSLRLNWHPSHYQTKQLPRLVYEQTVLGLATWYLSKADYQQLATGSPPNQTAQIEQFVEKWKLPRYFVLANGDRELLVDLHNELTVRVWIDTIRKQDTILLKEFLYDPQKSIVVDEKNRPFTNQCIASLIRKTKAYTSVLVKPLRDVAVRRTFPLGSAWLYYKFYCGTRSSDKILLEAVKPLVEKLRKNGQIDQWFFIRYTDPDDHLRLRLHLTDPTQIGKAIHRVNEQIEPFEQSGHIWKSHTNTYRRELERYGTATMALSETFFFHDSQAVLEMLARTQEDSTRSQRWLEGVATIDRWLTLFGYAPAGKQRLMKEAKSRFYEEFNVDKPFKRQIDARDWKSVV